LKEFRIGPNTFTALGIGCMDVDHGALHIVVVIGVRGAEQAESGLHEPEAAGKTPAAL
jgi:hypothetical protein